MVGIQAALDLSVQVVLSVTYLGLALSVVQRAYVRVCRVALGFLRLRADARDDGDRVSRNLQTARRAPASCLVGENRQADKGSCRAVPSYAGRCVFRQRTQCV